MYRIWGGHEDEYNYLDDVSSKWSVLPENISLEPNFSTIPEYSAPKEVYQTGRSMGNNKSRNKNYDLTWEFPVDSDFAYLVRLHFCEFQPEFTHVEDRTFLIYIANQTAEQQADIINWSGGNGRPVYKDYSVFMPAAGPGGTQKKVNLSLALQANQHDWLTNHNDAILNGLEIFKQTDSNSNLAGPNPDSTATTPRSSMSSSPKKPNINRSLAIVVGSVCALLFLFVLGFLILKRQRKSNDSFSGPCRSSLPSYLCRYFSLAEIKTATQNFNQSLIIGVGGFGNVYKGYIDGGATLVAIKRLKPESSQGALEFMTEIELLTQLRHRHLVSLIGYCTDKCEMILVYDYMERGTLADHLYHKHNPPLTWEQRLMICLGAARGLQYLLV